MENSFSPLFNMIWEYVTFEMFIKFCVFYFFVIWVGVIAWVIKDIVNRTDSLLLQIISVLLVLIGTPLGVFIYLIIRPSRTVFEKYYEEIENNLLVLTEIVKENSHMHKEKILKKHKKKHDKKHGKHDDFLVKKISGDEEDKNLSPETIEEIKSDDTVQVESKDKTQ